MARFIDAGLICRGGTIHRCIDISRYFSRDTYRIVMAGIVPPLEGGEGAGERGRMEGERGVAGIVPPLLLCLTHLVAVIAQQYLQSRHHERLLVRHRSVCSKQSRTFTSTWHLLPNLMQQLLFVNTDTSIA